MKLSILKSMKRQLMFHIISVERESIEKTVTAFLVVISVLHLICHNQCAVTPLGIILESHYSPRSRDSFVICHEPTFVIKLNVLDAMGANNSHHNILLEVIQEIFDRDSWQLASC